jgi:hypothetical protein
MILNSSVSVSVLLKSIPVFWGLKLSKSDSVWFTSVFWEHEIRMNSGKIKNGKWAYFI